MLLKDLRLYIFLFHLSKVFSFNADIPFSVLSQCKEYQIDDGYNYREHFNISEMVNNKPFPNELFRIKFYVIARNDAHLLLTNLPKVQVKEPAYEIVLGAYWNTESVIKLHKLGDPVLVKRGKIVSPLYPTEFIVALRDDGEISVILPDYDRPYMSFKDNSARFWKYFSLSAWEGVGARWFYDCPIGDNGL